MRLFLSIILFLSFSLTVNAQEPISNPVKFLAEPETIRVTIKDKKDKQYVHSCMTPCTLNLDLSRDLTFLGEKDGYKNSKTSKTYHSDSLNTALLIFNSSEFNQSTPAVKIALLPKKTTKQIQQGAVIRTKKIPRTTDSQEPLKNYYCGTEPNKVITTPPKPIKLAYPTVPNSAKTSGLCKIKYNVNYKGRVTHPEITLCSNGVFKRDAIKTIKKWRYAPSDKTLGEYQYCGIENVVVYRVFLPQKKKR